jgi:hypothetical protein
MQPNIEQTLCHRDGSALIKRKQIFPPTLLEQVADCVMPQRGKINPINQAVILLREHNR